MFILIWLNMIPLIGLSHLSSVFYNKSLWTFLMNLSSCFMSCYLLSIFFWYLFVLTKGGLPVTTISKPCMWVFRKGNWAEHKSLRRGRQDEGKFVWEIKSELEHEIIVWVFFLFSTKSYWKDPKELWAMLRSTTSISLIFFM